MTSAVARVDFHWLSFLFRSSHCTRPSFFALAGSSSRSVLSANACVSIVSLYQSQERSSGAQNVPCSSFDFAESMTESQTSFASAGRPERLSVRARYPLRYGAWRFQCLNEKSSISLRSASVKAPPLHETSGYVEST